MRTCTRCHQTLEESSFSKEPRGKDGLKAWCKSCHSEVAKAWYYKNHAKAKKKNREAYRANLEVRKFKNRQAAIARATRIQDLKRVPCKDCGLNFHPWQMDFDHLRDKKFNISEGRHRPWKMILEEVAKCDIVCSNCHRHRTYLRSCQDQTS